MRSANFTMTFRYRRTELTMVPRMALSLNPSNMLHNSAYFMCTVQFLHSFTVSSASQMLYNSPRRIDTIVAASSPILSNFVVLETGFHIQEFMPVSSCMFRIFPSIKTRCRIDSIPVCFPHTWKRFRMDCLSAEDCRVHSSDSLCNSRSNHQTIPSIK